ncbi:Uncharacterized protein Rs2_49133 [Raphanus sativus]|uniref:Uncharacterized protein LOC108845293 isoform X2 n=1 Tax=Raphanus sativus TaxID=3726 RepID=A0A9W3CTV9_RAPSA|nr:uncharacterized protein LOC108845293 isoform X2 [Raphanus sativus]KAJ4869321.1 Uncharacterized protein Rs2_49133 [Raphanus sativus]
MKKLFFFKSSSSSNATDKHILREKESKTSPKKSGGGGHALRRSRSLSSAAFLVDGTSQQRTHSSRCFTPGSQGGEDGHMYNDYSSPTCSSNLSTHVLDRFIDGEEHHCKQKISSSSHSDSSSSHSNHHSGSVKGRRLPPRVQTPSSPLSHHVQENCMKDASAPSLSRSVLTHSKASSYDSKDFDVYANLVPFSDHKEPMNGYYTSDHHTEQQELFLQGENVCKEGELEKKYKEAEKRVKLLSQEQKLFSDSDFDVSSLVDDERVSLALEVLTLLRSQMDERASAKEEIKRAKTDSELHIKRLEKEKSELQFELEKELDRRSVEWTSKLESFQIEEKRLRERVRELAEHNVSLQREVSTFHEKESERIDMMRNMEEKVNELSETAEERGQENVYLTQNLSKLQESYAGATEELDCVRREFEEKEMECKELHKSVARLVRTCGEQEKTIQGLRDSLSEETEKQPSEDMVKRLQMEQIRLTGVEFSLRKEVESMKLEADSLRVENACLRSYGTMTTFKLDNEMKMRVCLLQDQGVSMLSESTQLCYKLLKFIKERLSEEMGNGLSEQFLIESEMNVHGIRRGTESLKRSLQTVNSLLLEKSNEIASNSESLMSSEQNNQTVEKLLRSELRAETLVTSLLREKLYCKEQEIEQLQAEVAASVRGNEVLQREIQNVLDKLSINTHQLKDLKIQMVKKDENVKQLETNLQEAAKQFTSMKVTLTKVLEENKEMSKEVKECRKRNTNLESEKEMLKKEVERLEEDTLLKEGQITILKDTLGSKHFDLLSSPDFSYNEFLVQ